MALAGLIVGIVTLVETVDKPSPVESNQQQAAPATPSDGKKEGQKTERRAETMTDNKIPVVVIMNNEDDVIEQLKIRPIALLNDRER